MRKRTVLLVAAALAAVVSGLGFFWPFGRGVETLQLFGVVEIQEVRLGSKVGGRVAEVLAQEGERAEPYQPLVRFDVPELRTQKEQWEARLEAAAAEYKRALAGPRQEEKAAARALAAAAEAWYLRMKEGWREEEKQEARSQLETARAELKQTLEDFERVAGLYRQRSVARAEYEAALSARDRAQGRASAAQARYDLIRSGNRKEDLAKARAEWEKAKADHALLEAGTRPEDVALARARVDEIKARLAEVKVALDEAVVKAPDYPVLIEVVSVRKGDLVPPNQPVVRVLSAQDLWVKVYVPETELGKVRLKQAVEVRIDSYPSKRFKGTVVQVATISEFTPRNVQSADERRHQVFGVKVRVDDPQGIFKAGMAAEVFVPVPAD